MISLPSEIFNWVNAHIPIEKYWTLWLQNPGLTWGIGPVLAYIVSYVSTAVFMELLIRTSWAKDKFVVQTKGVSRLEAIAKTQAKIPLSTQLRNVLWQLFGPTAIFNAILAYVTTHLFLPHVEYSPLPESLTSSLLAFVAMELIGDFFLYWGHRIQHDIPYLWENFHHFHHTLDTPTPVGTIYIHSVDATLQGALPMLIAVGAVRPHPLVAYIYFMCRISENVLHHSGLNSWLLNALFLKFLPGRACVSHHDAHHKFSNYSRNAKNYGENFWIWDYLFGTLRKSID